MNERKFWKRLWYTVKFLVLIVMTVAALITALLLWPLPTFLTVAVASLGTSVFLGASLLIDRWKEYR